jgi:monofunctional biosynthetic peptidoglycan transglycosylase
LPDKGQMPHSGGMRMGKGLRVWRLVLRAGAVLGVTLLASVVLLRFIDPLATPLMLIRSLEGEGLVKRWVPLEAVSPELLKAVLTSEDQKFCSHHGFDWDAIGDAVERYQEGGRLRGGSTISQQTAKNVFLWPGRNFLRKGLEAGLTVLIETLWGKRRILEVYLNVVEWGPGLYGAEAAAQRYFHRPAGNLTRPQAAALAAVLPNPRRFSPVAPSPWVSFRIHLIESRMGRGGLPAARLCRGG